MTSSPAAGRAPFLTILIPVRNDGDNLRIMLRFIRAAVEVPHEVIVVYDDLADDAIPVIAAVAPTYPEVRGVHNQLGRGVINALRAGVAAAEGAYVLIFAADEVGPLLAVNEMIELAQQGCEFISATRYQRGGRRLGGSLLGGILSRLANWMLHRTLASQLSDSTTGIKMFRRDVFDMLQLESRPIGWAVTFEMAIKAQLFGLKLGEVPIISIDRLYGGKSTFRPLPWIREYLRWFCYALRHNRLGHGRLTVLSDQHHLLRGPEARPRARLGESPRTNGT